MHPVTILLSLSESMAGKKWKPPPLTQTCTVCGDPASTIQHYGATVCYSCRLGVHVQISIEKYPDFIFSEHFSEGLSSVEKFSLLATAIAPFHLGPARKVARNADLITVFRWLFDNADTLFDIFN